MNLQKSLLASKNRLSLSCWLILMYINILFVSSLSAQGLISTTNVIVHEEIAIFVNGNLDVQAPFLLNGEVHINGDVSDNIGILSSGGKLRFHGVDVQQYFSGNAQTTLCKMEVAEGSEVYLSPNKRLAITDVLMNHNEDGGLVLLSDDTGTASLLHYSANVIAVVQRYFLPPAGIYHIIASPVSGQSIADEFFMQGDILYAWFEPSQQYVHFENTTNYPTFADANQGIGEFLLASGYYASYPHLSGEGNPKSFAGPLQQGPINYVLTRKAHDDDPLPGYNLMGNPYPSAIDWLAEEGWSGKEYLAGEKSGIAWVWNEKIQNFGVIHPESRSQYHNRTSQMIPAMGGFFVQAAHGSHGEMLTMDDRVRVHDLSGSSKKTEIELPLELLRLKVECLKYGFLDEIIIEYGHQNLMSAKKLLSPNLESPQIYVLKDDEQYSLLLLTDEQRDRNYTVHVRTPVSGLFSLTMTAGDFSPLVEIINSQTNQRVHSFGEEPFVFEGRDSSYLEITVSHRP